MKKILNWGWTSDTRNWHFDSLRCTGAQYGRTHSGCFTECHLVLNCSRTAQWLTEVEWEEKKIYKNQPHKNRRVHKYSAQWPEWKVGAGCLCETRLCWFSTFYMKCVHIFPQSFAEKHLDPQQLPGKRPSLQKNASTCHPFRCIWDGGTIKTKSPLCTCHATRLERMFWPPAYSPKTNQQDKAVVFRAVSQWHSLPINLRSIKGRCRLKEITETDAGESTPHGWFSTLACNAFYSMSCKD